MDSAYMGSIMMWTSSNIPRGWRLCDGSTLQISQNQALFALLGTMYGGDGRTTFNLPDMRGRTAVGVGRLNTTGTTYNIGQVGGSETAVISTSSMPVHNHSLMGNTKSTAATAAVPTNNILGIPAGGTVNLYAVPGTTTPLHTDSITSSGNATPHNNLQPFTVLNYIICVQGIYPPRQ